MNLRGEGGDFHFDVFGWSKVLQLARLYGWRPLGTRLEEDSEGKPVGDWAGGYDSNDFQTVTAADARHLAGALERALPDVPGHDALGHKLVTLTFRGREIQGLPPDANVSPVEYFSGERKQLLQDFISFCRAGAFLIG
jgi:hypothetical protein